MVRNPLEEDLATTGLVGIILTLVYLVSDVLAERGVSPIALPWIGGVLVVLAVGLVVQRHPRRGSNNQDSS